MKTFRRACLRQVERHLFEYLIQMEGSTNPVDEPFHQRYAWSGFGISCSLSSSPALLVPFKQVSARLYASRAAADDNAADIGCLWLVFLFFLFMPIWEVDSGSNPSVPPWLSHR